MPVIEIETQEEFENIVLNKDEEHDKKYILVDFYTSWCGPCKRIAPKIEEFSEKYNKNVYFCKINAENLEDLSRKYNVNAFPTFLFFDVGDNENVNTVVIGSRVDEIENKLKYYNKDCDDDF